MLAQLYASGERDRLKELLTRRLEDSGWKDHVKELCKGTLVLSIFGKITLVIRAVSRTSIIKTTIIFFVG